MAEAHKSRYEGCGYACIWDLIKTKLKIMYTELKILINILKKQANGKLNAKKNRYLQIEIEKEMKALMQKRNKEYKGNISEKTIRKLIGAIREEGLITGLCASSNRGYWVSSDKMEIMKSGQSLIKRANKIKKRGIALLEQAQSI